MNFFFKKLNNSSVDEHVKCCHFVNNPRNFFNKKKNKKFSGLMMIFLFLSTRNDRGGKTSFLLQFFIFVFIGTAEAFTAFQHWPHL